MEYDLHRHSNDMRQPVHDFKGDQDIDPEIYSQAMYGGYVSTVTTLSGGARSYGLPIDGETFERWKRMCATAGMLDDFLDDSPDIAQAQAVYSQGIAEMFDIDDPSLKAKRQFGYLDARLQPAAQLLRNSVRDLPEVRRQQLVACGQAIGHIALTKAGCSQLPDYVKLLRAEASCSSQLIHGSVSPALQSHPGLPAFSDWCDSAFELATFIDSSRDLARDVRDGTTAVCPSLGNRLQLAWQGRPAYRHLIRRAAERHATIRALGSRLRYSVLPTALVMDK